MGKSYLTREKIISKYDRVLIADPMEEYYKALSFSNTEALLTYCLEHRVFRVRNSNVYEFDDLVYSAMQAENCLLVIEESQRYLPAKGNLSSMFSDMIFRGRHYACSVLLIMQRFSSTHIDVRSQWTQIYTFRQTEKLDTNWLRQTTGYELEELENLAPGMYYHITPHSVELLGNKFS